MWALSVPATSRSSRAVRFGPTWWAALGVVTAVMLAPRPSVAADGPQFVLVNLTPGRSWSDQAPDSLAPAHLAAIQEALPLGGAGPRRLGVSYIFSYLNTPSLDTMAASLRACLATAATTRTPVLITLDGQNWWGARPDLWNWWDPTRPGYDPANRANVEWTGPGPEHAIKVAWRNWGRQLRVLPPPNLLAPAYLAACDEALERFVPIIVEWYQALPEADRDLFVGLKLGWETSIGVSAWSYPNGNALADRDPANDPQSGLADDQLPSRGVATQGYAAAQTAGLLLDGEVTEAAQAEVVRRYLTRLCAQAHRLGVPRDRLFTHAGGWKARELLYGAALNSYSCPGWSFYRHAADPSADPGVAEALAASDAPWWGAVEWLLASRDAGAWRTAVARTLADPRCRLLCIYNWEGIADQPEVLAALREAAKN